MLNGIGRQNRLLIVVGAGVVLLGILARDFLVHPPGPITFFYYEKDADYDFSDLYLLDKDGARRTLLMRNVYGAGPMVWSPDGTHLAFTTTWVSREAEFYVVDLQGTIITRLDTPSAIEPTWSPDGMQIAFAYTELDTGQDILEAEPDTPSSSENPAIMHIWAMNVDGSNLRQLTSGSNADRTPAWSPDGTRIAFKSYEDGGEEIYVMNADGSHITRLTQKIGRHLTYLAWSPDGTHLLFRDLDRHIWVMNADGSHQVRVPGDMGHPFDDCPTWSPNGAQIAFTSVYRDGYRAIYVMDANGPNLTRLTDSSLDSPGCPVWSADGMHLTFSALYDDDYDDERDADIFMVAADGSDLTQLTHDDALECYLAWRP